MTLQTLVPYVPFIALLYALFALMQALRHKRQGIAAALLALVSIAAPVIAYLLSSDTMVRSSLVSSMSINAAIVFVASLLTLWIERRDQERASNRSYGRLGIGLSVLLAAGMFALPFTATLTSATGFSAVFNNTAANGDTVLVSNDSPSPALDPNTDTNVVQAQATQTADSTPSEVAQVLEAQTGLSADEIVSQTQAGSTIADLVSANNGDLDAVVAAFAKALDDLVQRWRDAGADDQRLRQRHDRNRQPTGAGDAGTGAAVSTASVDHGGDACAPEWAGRQRRLCAAQRSGG